MTPTGSPCRLAARTLLAAWLATSAVAAWPQALHAPTIQACRQSCGTCYGNDPTCEERRSSCELRCNLHHHGGAAPGGGGARRYGAIVYDRSTGAWGNAYGYADLEWAKVRAENGCLNAGGRACDFREWSQDATCLALAAGDGGKGLRGMRDTGRDRALAGALQQCRASGASGCTIQVWACPGGEGGGRR